MLYWEAGRSSAGGQAARDAAARPGTVAR